MARRFRPQKTDSYLLEREIANEDRGRELQHGHGPRDTAISQRSKKDGDGKTDLV